jgi:hypothetical protein
MVHESIFAEDLAENKRAVEQLDALVVQLCHALDRAIERQIERQKPGDLHPDRHLSVRSVA